ncbi:DUF58 domain-containing protein [Nocardiopsis sp. MG754419]|uniref:DUF58 domain-containing protein n=1 Tax=Nocardiopsis sp. MG754419 TaxID=2259865 RepID=UPI001BAD388D|nr:DUF58 domain-containing protein [Nocardiopsis sp. MG754419]MBR8741578.1 DUF58 domain-containing protein [Nocardiopsis sp. MG754419]
MRPQRTLTVRGGLMLFFGAVALVCGLVVGQREIVGVGLLLVLVPAIGALTLIGAAGRIVDSRDLRPRRIPAGTDTQVLIRVGNSSPVWPVGWVRLEDGLPVRLGHEPRYTLGYLGPRAVRDITYLVRPEVRGRYPVGPLRVSVLDALGCVRVDRPLGAPTPLLVTPRFVSLSEPGRVDGTPGEDSPRRSVTGVGERDPIPRAYRHGDELRRVHWRSTAKHGELMVRRDEQHRRERSTVLLDTRAVAHSGEERDGSLETAVSVAASIALHVLDHGHELRFHTERGRLVTEHATGVLDGLAVVESSEAHGLGGGVGALEGARGAASGLVVAVLGAIDAEGATALSRVGGSATRVAVLCTHAAWPDSEALRRAGDLLTAHGWRVLPVADTTELPPLWDQAVTPEGGPVAAGTRNPWEGPR